MKKKNVQFYIVLYRDSFVFAPPCGGARRKMYGCTKKLPISYLKGSENKNG